MNVLLVADDHRVAGQVRSALVGTAQLVLEHVATPARALAQLDAADEGAYDLVLADADTAPEGGFSLAREIKSRHKAGVETPPVVLLLARPHDRYLSNWSQADAYVLKPVDPFDLAEVVQALVDGREVPELPRVGGEPIPSVLDRPPAEVASPPAVGQPGSGGELVTGDDG